MKFGDTSQTDDRHRWITAAVVTTATTASVLLVLVSSVLGPAVGLYFEKQVYRNDLPYLTRLIVPRAEGIADIAFWLTFAACTAALLVTLKSERHSATVRWLAVAWTFLALSWAALVLFAAALPFIPLST
ncbi:MAG: hypothetical protein AAF533_07400 [Acidobacteriota bacterium]